MVEEFGYEGFIAFKTAQRKEPAEGDILQFNLADGTHIFGRVISDPEKAGAAILIYIYRVVSHDSDLENILPLLTWDNLLLPPMMSTWAICRAKLARIIANVEYSKAEELRQAKFLNSIGRQAVPTGLTYHPIERSFRMTDRDLESDHLCYLDMSPAPEDDHPMYGDFHSIYSLGWIAEMIIETIASHPDIMIHIDKS